MANSYGRANLLVSRLLFVDVDNLRFGRRLAIPESTFRRPCSSGWSNTFVTANSYGRANLLVSRLVIVLVYDKRRLGRRLALPESTTRRPCSSGWSNTFETAKSYGRANLLVSRLFDYSDPPRSSPIASATLFASAFPIASANSFGRANLLVSRLDLDFDQRRLGRRHPLPESRRANRAVVLFAIFAIPPSCEPNIDRDAPHT